MKILAVDTALGACSAAVLENEFARAHCFEQMERGHAERLASMVRETMVASHVAFDELDRLAVTVGPGTFTGQRVGYAFMRGLKLALKRPLVGVSTLEAMARAAMAQSGGCAAAVLHDAKRGEVYAYAEAGGKILVSVQLTTLEETMKSIIDATVGFDGNFAFAGTAGRSAAEHYRTTGRAMYETEIHNPDAIWVGRIALHEPEPEVVPRPLYLRRPDARLPGAAQTSTTSVLGPNAR